LADFSNQPSFVLPATRPIGPHPCRLMLVHGFLVISLCILAGAYVIVTSSLTYACKPCRLSASPCETDSVTNSRRSRGFRLISARAFWGAGTMRGYKAQVAANSCTNPVAMACRVGGEREIMRLCGSSTSA
jgi:hypothetical protein